MSGQRKTAIVTGGSQGIGAGVVKAFLERGYNVVANSRNITKTGAFEASEQLALVDGNIAEPATAGSIVETALSRSKSIDALVNNAGIFFSNPFMDYTIDDLRSLVSPLNGRTLTDDVVDVFLSMVTNGKVIGDRVGPHGDLVDEFPYLGRRTISDRALYSSKPQCTGNSVLMFCLQFLDTDTSHWKRKSKKSPSQCGSFFRKLSNKETDR